MDIRIYIPTRDLELMLRMEKEEQGLDLLERTISENIKKAQCRNGVEPKPRRQGPTVSGQEPQKKNAFTEATESAEKKCVEKLDKDMALQSLIGIMDDVCSAMTEFYNKQKSCTEYLGSHWDTIEAATRRVKAFKEQLRREQERQ